MSGTDQFFSNVLPSYTKKICIYCYSIILSMRKPHYFNFMATLNIICQTSNLNVMAIKPHKPHAIVLVALAKLVQMIMHDDLNICV